jgi:rhodanese-related sulfurtransferase
VFKEETGLLLKNLFALGGTMLGNTLFVVLLLISSYTVQASSVSDVSELLDKYAANQDRLHSWILKYESSNETDIARKDRRKKVRSGELRFDSNRMSNRCYKWGDFGPTKIKKSNPIYLSLTWDGETHIKYYKSNNDDPGIVFYDDFSAAEERIQDWEVKSLQYKHDVSVLMGIYTGTFERVDKLLRDARAVSVRDKTESINGVECFVIDAETRHGDYTIWIDPEHGYNIAKAHLLLSKDRNHFYHDKPFNMKVLTLRVHNVRFEKIEDVWVAMEADLDQEEIDDSEGKGNTHLKITELTLNPDHEALRSFIGGDIPNGTDVVIPPVVQIKYTWHDGELITKIDEDFVRRMDKELDKTISGGMISSILPVVAAEPNNQPPEQQALENECKVLEKADKKQEPSESKAISADKQQPRPHCGLYCIYSMLRLTGKKKIDFRELVKPEYFGSRKGSSLAELRKAATDYGLFAATAIRLNSDVLRESPYPAILHVKTDSESKIYEHYALFLGTENGQAKIFNPPEPVKLIPFRELAPLWDGKGLFLSTRPIDLRAVFAPLWESFMMYAAVVAVIVLLVHIARSRLPAFLADMSHRRPIMLTAVHGLVIVIAAMLGGIIYHYANVEGLLANINATASLQKAHLNNFIPKIGERKVRKLLDTDTVFIDARISYDYEAGHLKGSVSIPIDVNDVEYRSATKRINKDSSIVVYCQSAHCKFAERVAVKLASDGFSDISIFRGGWAEWVAKNGEPPKKTISKQNGARHDQT